MGDKKAAINVDECRLTQLVGQMLDDLGAASVAMVRMGDTLGL